ncbi:MAG: hypothetical protein K6E67_03280 [Prevotella sp.]|nr:hypothetical protein [Prevotella sp.]
MKRTYIKPTTKTVRLLMQHFLAASPKTEWGINTDGSSSQDIPGGDGKDPDADSRLFGLDSWDDKWEGL